MTRRTFAALGGAAAAAALGSAALSGTPAVPSGRAEPTHLGGTAFGTTWRLVLPPGADAAEARQIVTRAVALVDRQMSPWRRDSDLTRFNLAGPGRVALPPEAMTVARAAVRLRTESDGHFDPTVGPIVGRWGFGPIGGDPDSLRTRIEVSRNGLAKARAGQTLDLCGIAKGYALDLVGDGLVSAGHDTFLLDIGGELLAQGHHPSGRAWQTGVEDPRADENGLVHVLALRDMAVATSGTRGNSLALSGRRFSHIVDPITGHPIAGDAASVSVIAPSAMMADGWATALMAAGPGEGPGLAERQGIAALFLAADAGGLRRIATGNFDAHVLG
jgi:thiamine biosynthesis lipoprotein